MKRRIEFISCVVLMVTLSLITVCFAREPSRSAAGTKASSAPVALKKTIWNASLFGSPRSMTYAIEDWAKEMGKATDGLWEIKLHYGEVLAPAKEKLAGLKSNLFHAALWTPMYGPARTPLALVLELPFLVQPMNLLELGELEGVVNKHPSLVKELDKWNAQFLFPCPFSLYEFMGKKPIKKCSDLNGLRIRSAAEMGRPLEKFGAVITMMPTPEIYTALERGMLDSVLGAGASTFGPYRVYELSKHATTNVAAAASNMMFLVSKSAWNALPKQWQDLSITWANSRCVPLTDMYQQKNDAEYLPKFKAQGIEFTVFPVEERAKLIAVAEPMWEDWVKKMEGEKLPGRDVLNFAQAKQKEIISKRKGDKK